MFTGHVRELGHIDGFQGARVRIRAPGTAPAIEPGGAVCVSGVRLTVEGTDDAVFTATVADETRHRSTLGHLRAGDPVNVELPLTAGETMHGHLVQGCVDAVGRVARIDHEDECLRVWIRPPERLLRTLVGKSPIAVDGVSVTIAERLRDRFSVVVLPVTRAATTLDRLEPGARVNLELDLVHRLVASRGRGGRADLPGLTSALPGLTSALSTAVHVRGRAGLDQMLRRFAAGGAWPSGTPRPNARATRSSPVPGCAADFEVAALRWGLPLVEIAELKAWL